MENMPVVPVVRIDNAYRVERDRPGPHREKDDSPAKGPRDGDGVTWTDSLETHWGYGANENVFNDLIRAAVAEKWDERPALPALLLKATVAQESAFNPNAVSRAGYVGLLQLGTQEALSQGLKLEPIDERKIPEKNVPAGVAILAIKHHVVRRPTDRYDTDWARKVDAFYKENGAPDDQQIWYGSLAAYNGGGGTVLRAMAYAIDRGLDPREWDNVIGPVDHPTRSPLYAAVRDVFGPGSAGSKYREMSRYPIEIINRAGMA